MTFIKADFWTSDADCGQDVTAEIERTDPDEVGVFVRDGSDTYCLYFSRERAIRFATEVLQAATIQ